MTSYPPLISECDTPPIWNTIWRPPENFLPARSEGFVELLPASACAPPHLLLLALPSAFPACP
eukprot:CAMPEP_0182455516 /NCGR_PEP_ID=MMETSP1319-20130603/1652_1 /TAXON_ID=172717 /ORGANISM="Bolidomonas pacifica, Strain RCC208" /LENGTH=62 /DNA_ID=CAMNT_0024653587 /DNA_START=170 /DNA_END=354 /DNA_ORIENTATION=+